MRSSLASLVGTAPCLGCGAPGALLCEGCRSELRPAGSIVVEGVDRVTACWPHEGAPRELVLGLKLGGRRSCAQPLSAALVHLAHRTGVSARSVVWPPCSRSDKRRRGFDHAELLARGVAEGLGLPPVPLLRRVREASDQAALSGYERRTNLKNAFVAPRWDRPVLLVDDVITTGATLDACTRALRASGAPRVEALVACSAFS